MQTFLPFSSFKESAKCLDFRRLGKQRVEAREIIEILEGKESRWKNHPVVKMWWGYSDALKVYFNFISTEWIERGYKHTMGLYLCNSGRIYFPQWLFDEKFHKSHRANLLRKNMDFYQDKFEDWFDLCEDINMDYVWPISDKWENKESLLK